jgi:hypothetical protein
LAESSDNERVAALPPYLQPLLYDRKAQEAVRRAAAASQKAFKQARGKAPGDAIKDKRVRRRTRAAAVATWQALTALDAAQPRRRPKRRRRLALGSVAAVACGAYLLRNGDDRSVS